MKYNNLFEAISILQNQFRADFFLVKSGHSFHGFFDLLLDENNWKYYLGSLLLLNKPGKNFIDTRWVGHCLQQGYSSLRVTHTTHTYKQAPEFIRKLEYLRE